MAIHESEVIDALKEIRMKQTPDTPNAVTNSYDEEFKHDEGLEIIESTSLNETVLLDESKQIEIENSSTVLKEETRVLGIEFDHHVKSSRKRKSSSLHSFAKESIDDIFDSIL